MHVARTACVWVEARPRRAPDERVGKHMEQCPLQVATNRYNVANVVRPRGRDAGYPRAIMIDLSHRQREAEWMDAPDVEPAQLARGLRFIRAVNAMLGYTRATLKHLARFSRTWKPGETIRIVDFATGSADIPLAIVRWADRQRFDVRVVGVDLHAFTARQARRLTRHEPRISVVRGDVLELPFDESSFDYAITNMFLHHLDDDDVVRVLRNMDRLARRGIIAADLLRNRRAYGWISLFTLLANPLLRHDARVSVAQAFTREEICRLRDRAGIGFARFYRHFGHRFVLAGEKENATRSGR